MPRELLWEFGAFDGGESHDPCAISVLQRLDTVQAAIRERFGDAVQFNPLPYEGTRSHLGGGRSNCPTEKHLIQAIEGFNKGGIPFMVALNGGLKLPARAEIDVTDYKLGTEKRVLEALANSGETTSIQNHVTILHDGLLRVVRRDYPRLHATASCIRFVGGRKGEFKEKKEYTDAFNKFDAVVPLNQHTTPEFLAPWKKFAHKMMPLLNSKCDILNIQQCLLHYMMLEGAELPEGVSWETPRAPLRGLTVLGNADFGKRQGCSREMDGQLWRRTPDLTEFMRWGVDKFKLGRDAYEDPLNISRLLEFIKNFLENPPAQC